MKVPQPARIEADDEAQTLTIGWQDGTASVLSYEGLRQACPCAECRGGHGADAEPVDPVVFTLPALMRYEIQLLRPAGHYALQIVWTDGHGAGLWRWELLKRYGELAADGGR